MIKSTKYIILAAGIIGLISFFMPLISVSKAGITGKLSAYRIVMGISSAKDVVGKAGNKAKSVDEKVAVAEANKALGALRGIVLGVFFPALMIFIFGLAGTLRKSFGRGLAIPTFIFGLLGLGISSLLTAAAGSGGGESVAGSGMYMLLLASVVGTVGGLVAIIRPDRKEVASQAPQFATSNA